MELQSNIDCAMPQVGRGSDGFHHEAALFILASPRTARVHAVLENCTPWARGASSEKLSVHALQRTYCFHASPPDSRPHPVLCVGCQHQKWVRRMGRLALFPPNAAPISAPLVPTDSFDPYCYFSISSILYPIRN